MDYPMNCGLGSGQGNPLIPCCTCMPICHLGARFVNKYGAQLHFPPEGAKLLSSEGEPLCVLTTILAEDYWLFETLSISEDKITTWLDHFPRGRKRLEGKSSDPYLD